LTAASDKVRAKTWFEEKNRGKQHNTSIRLTENAVSCRKRVPYCARADISSSKLKGCTATPPIVNRRKPDAISRRRWIDRIDLEFVENRYEIDRHKFVPNARFALTDSNGCRFVEFFRVFGFWVFRFLSV